MHATSRASKVLASNRSYVCPTFRISIHTLNDFEIEYKQSVEAGLELLQIPEPAVGDHRIREWESSNNDLLTNLERKLRQVRTLSSSQMVDYRDKFLRWFLQGESVLDKLQADYPNLYESISRTGSAREKLLELESFGQTGAASEQFLGALRQFQTELQASVKSLSPETANIIVRRYITDWLMRCPLEFL